MAFSIKRFGLGSSGGSGGSSGAAARAVQYTAVGGESTFNVPIGFTMPSANYNVVMANADTVGGPYIPDFPRAGRTTTQFQMVAPVLTAGDTFDFILVPR